MATQLQDSVEMVEFTLNGQKISARADETILKIAEREGI